MKKIIILSALLMLIGVVNTFACDISINTDKKEYHIDEYAIVTVQLDQDHRNCLHELLETDSGSAV